MGLAGDVPAEAVRISVVVPAFNEEAWLPRTLESLHRQDYDQPYEVIVVDNNSTDTTAAVAARHGAVVLHEPHAGVCAARQRGTSAARGQIVISTDADTVHPQDWLARVDAAFSASDEVALVGGPCRYEEAGWWMRWYPRLLFGGVAEIHARTGRLVYVTATNTAFLRSAFPGYDPTLTQGGDELDVLRRLRTRGRMVWLADLVVDTSPRRLERGLWYSVFVSLLGRYLLTYGANRLLSRRILDTAPAFRPRPEPTPAPLPHPQPTPVPLPRRHPPLRQAVAAAAAVLLGKVTR